MQGDFSNIDWGSDSHFLKTELDASGGSNFVEMGTSQLISVPYAMYANEAGTSGNGKAYLTFYGDITDNEALQKIVQMSGPNTQVIRAVWTSQLSNLTLNDFEELEYLRILENTSLTTLAVPDLRFIMGDDNNTRIQGNGQLTTVDLSALEFVQGRLSFSNNTMLYSI